MRPPVIQDIPICFLTHFSSPPDAMMSCTLGGSAPTFWLHVGPSSPSFTVTVDRRMSQVNFLIDYKSSFSVSRGISPKTCLGNLEITYHPVLLVNFFSLSGQVWGADGGESKDSRFLDGSIISFCCEPIAFEEKTSRSLCTSLGTSTIRRPLLIALRPKMFPKLPRYSRVRIFHLEQDERSSEKVI